MSLEMIRHNSVTRENAEKVVRLLIVLKRLKIADERAYWRNQSVDLWTVIWDYTIRVQNAVTKKNRTKPWWRAMFLMDLMNPTNE